MSISGSISGESGSAIDRFSSIKSDIVPNNNNNKSVNNNSNNLPSNSNSTVSNSDVKNRVAKQVSKQVRNPGFV
jgi:hypothetical protein